MIESARVERKERKKEIYKELRRELIDDIIKKVSRQFLEKAWHLYNDNIIDEDTLIGNFYINPKIHAPYKLNDDEAPTEIIDLKLRLGEAVHDRRIK